MERKYVREEKRKTAGSGILEKTAVKRIRKSRQGTDLDEIVLSRTSKSRPWRFARLKLQYRSIAVRVRSETNLE